MTQHATSIAESRAASGSRSDRAVRSHHRAVLLAAIGLLVVAFTLRIADSGLVELPLLDIEMPALCTWQQLFGVNCPFCGLTRCFISAAHGQFARAWHFHPVGLILFFAVLAQLPYRAIRLCRAP